MKTERFFYDNDGSEVSTEKATWAEELTFSDTGTVIERRKFYTDKYAPTDKVLLGSGRGVKKILNQLKEDAS